MRLKYEPASEAESEERLSGAFVYANTTLFAFSYNAFTVNHD